MDLPQDPYILYGVINMKLRDYYPSLDALCDDLDIKREDIEKPLKEAGFEYDEKLNKFI